MPFLPTPIEGLLIFEPAIYADERGYFTESYNKHVFAEAGITGEFVQDNQALSQFGVVRGLHYQCGVHAQAKLVRVLQGEVLDVVVDLRIGSPTYGEVYSLLLSEDNKRQLYVPKGFAHGYSVLSSQAVFFYKCDQFYNKESEGGIHPEDPALPIDWCIPSGDRIISSKDHNLPFFGHHRPFNS